MIDNASIDKLIGAIFNSEMNGQPLGKTDHPVNYFARGDAPVNQMDACWDILAERWVKPPHLTPATFDPEAAFPEVWAKAERFAEEFDIEVGHLKRDIIEYRTFLDSVRDAAMQKLVMRKAEAKLAQIDAELQEIVDQYDRLHEERRTVFSRDPDAVREVWMATANWSPENVLYKLLERWRVLSLMVTLKHIVKAEETPEERVQETAEVLL